MKSKCYKNIKIMKLVKLCPNLWYLLSYILPEFSRMIRTLYKSNYVEGKLWIITGDRSFDNDNGKRR